MVKPGSKAEVAMTPAPALKTVRIYDKTGMGYIDESRLLEEFVGEAAETILGDANLDLSDEERARMVAFAQEAGNLAIEAASIHMGLKGWMRFTYDTEFHAARTYGISDMASYYPELTVARPAQDVLNELISGKELMS